MKSIKSKIKSWWTKKPMTYSLTHGSSTFSTKSTKFGSRNFFDASDARFIEWNKPLHLEKPFSKIFNYKKFREKKILEIGCGIGLMSMLWAKNGSNLTAIDLNPQSISLTKKRFRNNKLKGKISLGDANKLKFINESFDYVYSWGVLHHSPDFEKSVSEMMRVTKAGGGFGVMVYNRNSVLFNYMIKYREGFLHLENKFNSKLSLASKFTDGAKEGGNPFTWPLTKKELIKIFQPFSNNFQIKILGTDLDATLPQLFPYVGRYMPLFLKKSLARRFGWSIWISGEKN